MGTQIVGQQQAIPALAMDEQELAHVLGSSLYPGASMPSIKMVVSYCRAAQLDPMQKPVHIVPMWDKNSKSMRDVIMPGVGLYRTQAARSGGYAGMSEPEFGPDVTGSVGGVEMTYPKWCKVVVRRLLPNGMIVDFPAVEYWKENYATSGKDSEAPNAMWRKRPYGQISKCAEAQALRKAFPEIGSQPTAEEMEGKEIVAQAEAVIGENPRPALPSYSDSESSDKPDYPGENFDASFPKWASAISAGKKSAEQIIATVSSKYSLNADQLEQIRSIEIPGAEHADA